MSQNGKSSKGEWLGGGGGERRKRFVSSFVRKTKSQTIGLCKRVTKLNSYLIFGKEKKKKKRCKTFVKGWDDTRKGESRQGA